MKLAILLVLIAALGRAQNQQDVLKRGEQVFNMSCATGYCHGAKGAPAGAPRLAARGFDQAYITNTILRGIPGTAMPAFAESLSRPDLIAVITYVASLNGITNPTITIGRGGPPPGPPEPPLPPEAARGRDLFFDAVRGFSRCSTCHEVNGMGLPVATPISKVPADVAALRALATPAVSTAALHGEKVPALIVSQGKQRTIFYDLSSVPPIQRTIDPAAVQFTPGSTWNHSSVIGAYTDQELAAILAFLRAVTP